MIQNPGHLLRIFLFLMISLLQVFPVKGCLVGSSNLTTTTKTWKRQPFFSPQGYTQLKSWLKVLQVFFFAASLPIPFLPTCEGSMGKQAWASRLTVAKCWHFGAPHLWVLQQFGKAARQEQLLREGVSEEQRQQHNLRLHKTLSCEMFFRENNPLFHFTRCSLSRASSQSCWVKGRPCYCTQTLGFCGNLEIKYLQ